MLLLHISAGAKLFEEKYLRYTKLSVAKPCKGFVASDQICTNETLSNVCAVGRSFRNLDIQWLTLMPRAIRMPVGCQKIGNVSFFDLFWRQVK